MNDPTDITGLANLITESVSSLVNICAANGFRIPRLEEGFTRESEAFRSNKDAAKAATVIAAAAFKLAAILLPPEESIFQTATGNLKSAALQVAITCHVPEILRDAGPQGLHSSDIAKKSGVDDMKLARLLRYLANRHIFREVTPDVFTHNRISGVLDTGKSINDILRDPESKHDGTNGFVALVEHYLSEGHKGSAYLAENMRDPKTSHSAEVNQAPLQRGLRTDLTYWEWYSQPEQLYHRRRFGIAMAGTLELEPPNFMANVFDWKSLPADSPIVDVGGGVGSSAMAILKAFPDLCAVVQDLSVNTEQAIEFWKKEMPDALDSQRIKLQGLYLSNIYWSLTDESRAVHDFFTPQPITNASAFLLRLILHDWPDAQSVKILTHLRKAATPSTRLIILDSIIPYTCDIPNAKFSEFETRSSGIPGLSLGAANEMAFTNDISMMVWVNSQEHTLRQFRKLFELSGWRLVNVTRNGNFLDCIEALPSWYSTNSFYRL
ncbi:S-adenosyl-L-methionine-dependent methyltransferase [Collybia nuda]|uniref:S-adenosyl-L-methionine-dependent methyltransferase n=1 Tax=Collybia nuda TaxID=64659 RepID=A0A9P6CGU0_9AGAR|nr:S-adenosyl-L-methionine-dependent methyltransferase [Collybia nuda]